MAKYTILNAQQINQIGGKYGIKIDQFESIEGGAGNTNYMLSSSIGKYVLTICEEKSKSQVEIITKLLHHLELHKFPTTVVIPNKNSTLVTEFENHLVIVKKYIEGRVIKQLDERMLNQAGETLASLHQLPAPEYLNNTHSYGYEMFSSVIGKNIDVEYENWLNNHLSSLRDSMPANLPKSLIHGDLFYDNLVFKGDRLQGIIDFEEACRYYRIFDIGMALLGLCSRKEKIFYNQMRPFLEGYSKIVSLEIEEKNALQSMLEYAAIATSYWRFWKYHINNPTPERADWHRKMARFADVVQGIPKDEFNNQIFV